MTCKDCDRRIVCRYYTQWANIEQVETDRCQYFKNKAEVEEVKHGEWVSASPSGGYDFYCSCCKEFAITYEDSNYREQYYLTDYCPNCGAKLDGDDWIIK